MLFRSGTEAIKALIELDRHNMTPKGFIVSDGKNQPDRILGIPVYAIDKFLLDEKKWIWPCLINGREDVLKTLCARKHTHILL